MCFSGQVLCFMIDDEAKKQFGPVFVLNYGKGERMLKVEISTELLNQPSVCIVTTQARDA